MIAGLHGAGWRVLIVWECCLKGPGRLTLPHVVRDSIALIRTESQCAELRGFPDARSPVPSAVQAKKLIRH